MRPTDLDRRAVLTRLAAGAGLIALGACSADESGAPNDTDGDESGAPIDTGVEDPWATFAYPDDWFPQAQYGVMVHFLGEDPGWNERVDGFDVELFAEQMASARAGYVIFTLGQNSGYHCSPNATYDRYAGYEAGDRSSVRDLPMDLADALAPHGIPLMLYLPSRAPQGDAQAMAGLSAHAENDQWQPATQEFTRKWSEVIEEWSMRYGRKVRGWWFDGAYSTPGWDDLSMPYNWSTWAAACRSGNPDSILAFNRGAFDQVAFIVSTDEQDYTAGEQTTFTATPETHPAPAGVQWHLLCHLGSDWGFLAQSDPQLSDAEMIAYLEEVFDQGGVVTLDVAALEGDIHPPQLLQLEAIAAAIRSA